MDEPTARLIADQGIWLSTQAFPDEMANAFPPGSLERAKAVEVFAGTDRTFTLAKKYKIKTAFGTDILFSPALAQRQGELLAKLVRWYTPAEALIMATGTNAQLLALSGKRSPYPGKLGVVEEGALADLHSALPLRPPVRIMRAAGSGRLGGDEPPVRPRRRYAVE